MDLKDWTIQYVKYKDLLKKELKNYKEGENKVRFVFKDRVHDYYLAEELDLISGSDADQITIVCPCTEENLGVLIKKWKEFSKAENLTVIFVNIEENNKWIIRPQVHARIADPESLEEGLRSMYEQVASE